jgi:hypothetical protein
VFFPGFPRFFLFGWAEFFFNHRDTEAPRRRGVQVSGFVRFCPGKIRVNPGKIRACPGSVRVQSGLVLLESQWFVIFVRILAGFFLFSAFTADDADNADGTGLLTQGVGLRPED